MSRKSKPVYYSKSDLLELKRLAADSHDQRLSLRCQMVLRCIDGSPIKEIAAEFHERPNTVILWRNRFTSEGIPGLHNRPRGKPASVYDKEAIGTHIQELLQNKPPEGATRWNGRMLAEKLGVPPHVVWRYLKKHKINLSDMTLPVERNIKLSLELPITISLECKEAAMKNTNNKMNLEIIARISDDNGNVIEKKIRLDQAIPNVEDFDLSTREGFLRDFDDLERNIINARNQMGDQITAAFMEEASKKNSRKPKPQQSKQK